MEASWKNCFEEELLCPICLNVFDEPIQLPCGHNFCKGCISTAWAKSTAAVRCPECNHDYKKKPTLEKNLKLFNIVNRFNALNTEKDPAVLHCVLCRRGPPLPVRKVCLRCKEPCCQSHIQTHLQQPCEAPGHLMVEVEELSAWTCPSHEEYRLLHCEEEQVALCPFCCVSKCNNLRHTVRDVDTHHIQMQATLMTQQNRLDDRVQNINVQISKLKSDTPLVKDAVNQLKQLVRGRYQKMHALLDEKQTETMMMLDNTCSTYLRKNNRQVLQLRESRHEAEKLQSSVQTCIQRADSLNFMKNTRPYQLAIDRSNLFLSSGLPSVRVGQLNSSHFLSSLSNREETLRTFLDDSLIEVPVIEMVQHSCINSHLENSSEYLKRKYNKAFLEDESTRRVFPDMPRFNCAKRVLAEHGHSAPSPYTSEVHSQNSHAGPARIHVIDASPYHMAGVTVRPSHHSGNTYAPPHFPGAAAPQQGKYKAPMCSLTNFGCSRGSATATRPTEPPSNSFPPMPSQEFAAHMPLPANQPQLQFSLQELMEAPQIPRRPDLFGLFDPSSYKLYRTKI